MNFTDDTDAWWQLEHAFAGHIERTLTEAMPNPKHPLVEKMLDEDIYLSALSYVRGLEQDDFVELVRAVKPELLKMVEDMWFRFIEDAHVHAARWGRIYGATVTQISEVEI